MERKDLHEEFEELMSLFLFGETTQEENRKLNEIIDLEPELKRRYENYIRTQGGLKEHKLGLEKLLFETPKRSGKTGFLQANYRNPFLAAAAMVFLVVSLTLIFKTNTTQSSKTIPMEVAGNCDREKLLSDWIQTDPNSFCDVKIDGTDGTVHFRIFPNSKVRVLNLAKSIEESKTEGYKLSLFLQKGNLLLNEVLFNPQGKTTLYIDGTSIRLTGTKVWIQKEEGRAKIDVWDGAAEIRSGVRYILPFLLDARLETSIRESSAVQNENTPTNSDRIFKDVFETKISNASLETDSLSFTNDSSEDSLSILEQTNIDPRKTSLLLEKIQKKIETNLSGKKPSVLSAEHIQNLERFSERLENSKSVNIELPLKIEKESKTFSISKVPASTKHRPETEKEEPAQPVRLGNKTIRLKDGTELKGNVTQYGDKYVVEIEGRKQTVSSKEVESISF
ncbi:transcriptional regulator [Leptospira yasudae]|uniref:Transcriptional regulator n=1 Tax=Leptospira yasudae TaxID=2202201 RepID=A0A6N4QSK2_9LEPT|nr:transcriptional regulator [Leptospira yasudae]TGL73906.1 transcriptional regulator [Leptospira yasudae]TGL79487.1 transcriptional regulator [Leptospira yasudae]TGL90019.1 transcriptional regulator [Leptospira yasudae]